MRWGTIANLGDNFSPAIIIVPGPEVVWYEVPAWEEKVLITISLGLRILLTFCDVKKHTVKCVGWSHACQHGFWLVTFWLVTFTKGVWWHHFCYLPSAVKMMSSCTVWGISLVPMLLHVQRPLVWSQWGIRLQTCPEVLKLIFFLVLIL